MQYGPVMIDLEGSQLTSLERELLTHKRVGGVLLFSRNYAGLSPLKKLVTEIRTIADRPLLIAVDHEGGRVWRFNEDFTVLPPAKDLGTLYESDPEKAKALATHYGYTMASELLDCDIDISFAPVLDLGRGISEVIGDRAFHADPNIVTLLARAFIEGMRNAGMSATGKHFPGHGGCAPDSHTSIVVDSRPYDVIEKEDLLPFKELAQNLGAIMPAHIIFPAVDTVPAGYSKTWLQDILRKKLKFQGAIISDCLSMKGGALSSDYVIRARMALDAGCDMVILCQQSRELLKLFLDNLARDTSIESYQRLKALKGQFSFSNSSELSTQSV